MSDHIEITNKKLRTFGIALMVFLGLIGYSQFKKGHIDLSYWYWGIGVTYAFLSLAVPVVTKPVYRGAMFLAYILGWINTRLILGILYYVIFTPLALIFRLIRRDALDRKWDKNATSYWKIQAPHQGKEQYLKQF